VLISWNVTDPETITLRKMSGPCKSLCGQKCLEIPVYGYWKSEHHFPYLKAASQELQGMTATSAPSERVFGHADELYRKKRATLGIQIFAIHKLMRMNPRFGMKFELGLSRFDLCKCNSNSNFSSISGFPNSANFNFDLICES